MAIASARTGSRYERLEMAAGARASPETTVELTYLAPFGSWLAVQPDLQYVTHPGNAPTARYVLAPGFRVSVSH